MNRVIVVDDNETICSSIRTILEEQGILVDIFTNPLEALSSFRINCYDLAIVDIKMPQMNGLDLIGAFRAERPAVAVIILSSHIDVTDFVCNEMMKHHCDLALSKPFSLVDLTTYAQQLLRNSTA